MFWRCVYSRHACSASQSPLKLRRLLAILPSPESRVTSRSTLDQSCKDSNTSFSICLNLRDCVAGDWAQRCSDHRGAPGHLARAAAFVQIRPPMGEILCWALVRYSSENRWPTIDMQGSLSNAGAVLRRYRRRGKRVDGV